ncbi:MAG: flagellar hook-basal body complex protein [Marivivens sp.]|uniref:flagellar basal body rod protein FlgF n=1 Tax=Marivivens sp. TaxID=1978374 RepID=UPI001823233D|nr:flagellar hook-basal body complex protein [Marivivens sp.]NVJ96307.1 flagellar hook-basal body complex protein [Marivivens sp.]
MDRMVHTLMNSMQTVQDLQAISAQNLANMNVPGYRRDLPAQANSYVLRDNQSFEARMFASETEFGSFASEVGFMDQTGDPFDVAIMEEGYFFVKEGNGEVGLTRRGDLRTDSAGQLVNGGGEMVLDTNMSPITLPPYRTMQITEVGQIVIEPIDGAPGEIVEIATIGTVVPDPNTTMVKGLDGLIRNLDGTLPQPNQMASVRQGVLEGANVNATEELISSITIQRSFEMNMRMINTAKELDEAGTEIMRAPA